MNKTLVYNSNFKITRDFSTPKHLDNLLDLHHTHSYVRHTTKLYIYYKGRFEKT